MGTAELTAAGLLEEPRFVEIPLSDFSHDWRHGVIHGEDYWAKADRWIARRRAGEVDRESASLPSFGLAPKPQCC